MPCSAWFSFSSEGVKIWVCVCDAEEWKHLPWAFDPNWKVNRSYEGVVIAVQLAPKDASESELRGGPKIPTDLPKYIAG